MYGFGTHHLHSTRQKLLHVMLKYIVLYTLSFGLTRTNGGLKNQVLLWPLLLTWINFYPGMDKYSTQYAN